jgi:O-antigen biosynthesis protein
MSSKNKNWLNFASQSIAKLLNEDFDPSIFLDQFRKCSKNLKIELESLFVQAILLKPDKPWPYFFLAEIADSVDDKLYLYRESLKVNKTDYAKKMIESLSGLNFINLPNKIISYEKFPLCKNILYFSPEAPDFDCSSGGNRLYEILKILADSNFNVYFLCNNSKNIKHLNCLKDLKINCFEADFSKRIFIQDYIKQFKEEDLIFEVAIFSWYDSAHQYFDFIKEQYPDIKTIIDTVDVHWKREFRGFEKGIFEQKQVIERKNIEIEVYSKADVLLAVTQEDALELKKELGEDANVKILSNIHKLKNNETLGQDIVFIGNYNHTPNVDAVIDCIDIFQQFSNTDFYKNLSYKPKLRIAGPNLEFSILEKAQNIENIVVEGHVHNLNDFYKNTKVLMAPINWGAGIKGKICDSCIRGVPVITTDIGNEGINLIDNESGFVANTKDEFLEKLKNVYSMPLDQLKTIAKNGQNLIDSLVSPSKAKNVLVSNLIPKNITISVVMFNKLDIIKNCLNSILKNTQYSNYKIALTDNTLNPDVEDYVLDIQKLHKEKIVYFKNQSNDYFVESNNKIFNHPDFISSDVVLINDDIEIISECWLSYLYSAAYSEYDICAVGGKILHPDNKVAECGSELNNQGFGGHHGYGLDPNIDFLNKRRHVGYCSGCLLYMRRDALDLFGVFDKDFAPMYFEDSEWQYRCHIGGYKTIYEPKCVAIHHEEKQENKPMKKHQEVNRNKFLEKYKDIDIEKYN